MLEDGMIECSNCHSKLLAPGGKGMSRAYDKNRNKSPPKHSALNVLLVAGDCVLVGLQVHLQKLVEDEAHNLMAFDFEKVSLSTSDVVIFALV
ncbi:hypothetical protein OPV22_024672 [Ensete ventricosum]|uniref:Uncharacterized protein n=1 Tax=Ensete ventricosum TaxID=4639 RepID=A0AAV8QHE0_ENSVE|nr:hypothetical protein OPV22_024672 [Ensete ventricosum]